MKTGAITPLVSGKSSIIAGTSTRGWFDPAWLGGIENMPGNGTPEIGCRTMRRRRMLGRISGGRNGPRILDSRKRSAFLAVLFFSFFVVTAYADDKADDPSVYSVHPIGHVEKHNGKTAVVLKQQYRPGLLRLDDFSHVWVIWWFDRNDTPELREILQVYPRRDSRNPLSGVFATRAPVRPNLIGLTLCRIIAVNENVIEIDGIDAFDGTPVLDLKPYIPSMESIPTAKIPERF